MAVKIIGSGAKATTYRKKESPTSEVKVDQFEVFGRLDMSRRQIAQYYNLTENQVRNLFEKPEIKNAFERGRAETVIAIRQKQLQLGLSGNTQLLIHIGHQFAEQEQTSASLTEKDLETSRFSWDQEMKRRIAAVSEKFLAGDG